MEKNIDSMIEEVVDDKDFKNSNNEIETYPSIERLK